MIDFLRELSGLIKELPDLAMYILIGVLVYKTFVMGGIFSLLRFAIKKAYDFATKPEIIIKQSKIKDEIISFDGSEDALESLLRMVRTSNKLAINKPKEYISMREYYYNANIKHIKFITKCVEEKLATIKGEYSHE
jgi:hypothetical protein